MNITAIHEGFTLLVQTPLFFLCYEVISGHTDKIVGAYLFPHQFFSEMRPSFVKFVDKLEEFLFASLKLWKLFAGPFINGVFEL